MVVNQISIQTKQKRLARYTLLANFESYQQAIDSSANRPSTNKISISTFNRERNKKLAKKVYFFG